MPRGGLKCVLSEDPATDRRACCVFAARGSWSLITAPAPMGQSTAQVKAMLQRKDTATISDGELRQSYRQDGLLGSDCCRVDPNFGVTIRKTPAYVMFKLSDRPCTIFLFSTSSVGVHLDNICEGTAPTLCGGQFI